MSKNWKEVVGYEDRYMVSDEGDVKSIARISIREGIWYCTECGSHRLCYDKKERILKAWTMGKYGHLYVGLYKNNSERSEIVAVHRLVLLAFVGPCPEGMECRHLDGNPANNCLSNLKWGTDKENCDDREQHGTHIKGSDSHRAVLTEQDIPVIRFLLRDDRRGIMTVIAERYNIAVGGIKSIRDKETWNHVPEVIWEQECSKECYCGHCKKDTINIYQKADNKDYNYRKCTNCNWYRFSYMSKRQKPIEVKIFDRKGQKPARFGSGVVGSKLNDDKIREIRRLHKTNKYTLKEIGDKMGVSMGSICDIIKGRTWKHVKE